MYPMGLLPNGRVISFVSNVSEVKLVTRQVPTIVGSAAFAELVTRHKTTAAAQTPQILIFILPPPEHRLPFLSRQGFTLRPLRQLPKWVKAGNTRRQQMLSASPSKADLEQRNHNVSFVPTRDSCIAATIISIRSPRRRGRAAWAER